MWFARGEAVKAASIMKQAVQLALRAQAAPTSQPASADTPMPAGRQAAELIREQLLMLLNSKDDRALLREADEIIARFGSADLASAWAHLARAAAHRNAGATVSDVDVEYDAAFAAARIGGEVADCLNVIEVIASAGGPDAALRRIAGFGAGKPHNEVGAALVIASDPHWDVVRIEMLDRKGDLAAAAKAVDTTLPRLSKLSPDGQISLLRLAADVYGRQQPVPQFGKAKDAYLSILQRVPDDRFALNDLACILLDSAKPARPKEALGYSLRAYNALKKNGQFDPHIGDTYGWALACTGQYDDAIAMLTLVVRLLPQPNTEYHLGQAHAMSGNPKEALAHFRSAIQLILQASDGSKVADATLKARLGNAYAQTAACSLFRSQIP